MRKFYIPKLSTIEVEDLRLRAYIGFQEWEREKLQDLVISFSFKYDVCFATESDDVKDALDYKSLTKSIIALVDRQQFNLIETLAEVIYNTIQTYSPNIQDIEVKLEKPHALRFADNVMVRISSSDRYNKVMVALGSNINREENFSKALEMIQQVGLIVKRTDFINTKALKYEDQADFLNGAILLMTNSGLLQLQMELKQIESIIGRVRTKNKNAPRVIDLDIITFNGAVLDKDIHELPFLLDFLKNLQPEIMIG